MRLLQRKLVACLIGMTMIFARPIAGLAQTQTSNETVKPLDLSYKPIAAQPAAGVALSLPEALARALAHNPGLRAASREQAAAEGALEQGRALPNPELSYEMEDTRKETRTNTLLLTQPLELGGKRAARVDAAERSRELAALQLTAKQADLRAQVSRSFREALAAQEALRLSDEALVLAQRATQAAMRRVQAGSASPQEETKARLEEASAKVARAQAQAELASAHNRLAALWGEAQAQFARVQGRLDELPEVPTVENLLARMEQAPALRMAEREIARRDALASIERSRRYPDMSVSVGIKRATELGRNQAILGISMPLPLFDSNRGALREALARGEQARDEQAATRVALAAELLQARNRLLASRLEAESLSRDVLPGANSALDAVTRGYELGKFGFLDVLDAQRSLSQVRIQHLRAQLDAHKAAADIAQLLGDEPTSPAYASPAP